MTSLTKCTFLLLCISYVKSDDVDNRLRKGVMLKFLREMVNQTIPDTLDLPANSTTIRENITDTFSCENRTYGYYADVDNDCQVFHVCLTQKAASQRNMTFRWSFICPNETIFNQEILTCTRPRESVRCEDAPMYYDVNLEIGKITNDTAAADEPDKEKNTEMIDTSKDKNKIDIKKGNKKKQTNRRKHNLIQKLQEVVEEDIHVDDIKGNENLGENVEEMNNNETVLVSPKNEKKPVIHEVVQENELTEEFKRNPRIIAESGRKRRGKKYRGTFRFKADVK